MLTLKSLTFSGIGRFVEEQIIDFTSLGSLVQVDGQNNNTGGSSGSGKSTIFKALEYLLGINDISNGVLQSRLTKDPMSVTGIFELDGRPLKIQRNKKFSIDLDGEVTTGSSKLTEERLDQIIGMPRDLFRKILHKRQGEGGFFLDMGPSEVHKFLTNCLGLQKEQEKIIIIENRFSLLLDNEIALKSTIESNKMGLEATQSAISSLGPKPIQEISHEAIKTLETNYTASGVLHQNTLYKCRIDMEELERLRPSISSIPFDRSNIIRIEKEIGMLYAEMAENGKIELNRQSLIKYKISGLESKLNKLKEEELARQFEIKSKISSNKLEITKLTYLVNEGNKAKEEATIKAEELKKIRSSVCPTCEQRWEMGSQYKESNLIKKLQEYKKIVISGIEASNKIKEREEGQKILEFDVLPKAIPEIDDINAEIRKFKLECESKIDNETLELKSKIDSKNKEIEEIRKEEKNHQFKESTKTQTILVNYAQKQTELRLLHENILKPIEIEVNRTFQEYNVAITKFKSVEDSKNRFDDSFGMLHNQMIRYQNQLNDGLTKLATVQEEMELAAESKKAIKSYLSCSFEDALDSIGDTATKFIRNVPNMQNGTIQFEGLKETKDGKIKEEVSCLISMDGEIGIPVKSLSGGERSSTDLAIDLAVMEFIQERAGKGINLFILDEPFTGLDEQNISSIVELLRESGVDKQILIVDHNPIIKETFESKVTVIRDGLTSKVVQ